MIFKRNRYGRYLPICEEYLELENIEDEIEWIDFDTSPERKSGFDGLKERIMNAVSSVKEKAMKALGMQDGFSIKSCINRLKSLLFSFVGKVKHTVRNWTPALRNFVDKICDCIQSAIDYIKRELS